jgi:hypothetical protein
VNIHISHFETSRCLSLQRYDERLVSATCTQQKQNSLTCLQRGMDYYAPNLPEILSVTALAIHIWGKVSVKVTEHHAMNAHWRSGGIAPRILDLGTRWRWVVGFTPRPLHSQGKILCYPLDREGGWAPEPIWTRWRRETFPALPGLELPIIQPVAQCYTTELSHLLRSWGRTLDAQSLFK